ncbi:MAG: radical SAM protein [Desulfobacterales bacterium]|nr:radical SAM protein [Desulfobacterales bacterium]
MKILLIYPYFIEERIQDEDIKAPPIGLYSVGAVLKENDYDVDILNWHDIHKRPHEIRETLLAKKPDVIGFSILHANRWGGIEIARTAKELDPTVKIVFGGIGASFLWEHFLRHFPEVDFVVLGEGEFTFLSLIKYLEKETEEKLEDIMGIAYRKHGNIERTEDAEYLQNLDMLPIPAKSFLYRHVSSSRGCPWNCTFCGSPQFWGRKVRFRSPEHFVLELEILYQKGITFFYFSDDTFTMNKKRVIEICKRIIERGLDITWYAISRVNDVNGDVLAWMRKAGCIQISYGIESGSEEIRDSLNKDIKKNQIKKAFSLTTKYGILPRAYFIYGCPGETWETIQDTLNLIQEIKPLSTVFYILDLYPGTRLYSDAQKRLNFTDDIWLKRMEGIMYFETDPELSDDMVLAFGKRLRTGFYENLHAFAGAVRLIDDKELYEWHADFCSRLGMTFSHGDYSRIDEVKEKGKTAEGLYRKSLAYYPNHRAYLGLGVLKQRNGEYEESIKTLSQGLRSWPNSEELNLCLALSTMNLQDYKSALALLSKFPDSPRVKDYITECKQALDQE